MDQDVAAQLQELHARVCKAIADPKRLLIINELRDRELSVGDLCDALGISQSNASQHLAVLRERGQGQRGSRRPDALSASFVEIARHVEPAVVNIDTLQTTDIAESDNEDKSDRTPSNPLYDLFRRQPPRPFNGPRRRK